MNSALGWLTPDVIQALGWTLVHFLWQGAAIALLLYIAAAFSRSALVRYNAGVGALVAMAGSPLITFLLLRRGPGEALHSNAISNGLNAVNAIHAITNTANALPGSATTTAEPIDWLSWFVWAWFAGVLVFGLRALGGWVLLERLRRERAEPVMATLRQQCLALQRRLGLSRTVQYLESHLMDSPAVVGWFRPVVLLPVTALTGLSPEQLEAVIVHELAHIKRLDCFVNLFQIAAETVLFYHPAVWWVSRYVRTERENCCDDIAVSICGNAGEYARALTLMETWRATPALVLAANSGSLRSRISRLLGFRSITRSVPRGGLAAVGILCAAGALLASTTFNVTFSHPSDPDLSSPQAAEQSTESVVPADAPAVLAAGVSRPAVSALRAAAPTVLMANRAQVAPMPPNAPLALEAVDQAQTAPAPPEPPIAPAEPSGKGSYIDGLRAAGITDLNVDDLIALKIQGVTPEYIREMRATGMNPSVHDLIALKVQGVTPEYVRDVRATGLNPSMRDFISMKTMGVSPEFVREVRSSGWNDVTVHDLVSMKAQGVNPADAGQFRQLGLKDVTLHQLISLKAMGVTPEYIRSMQSAGLSNLDAHEYISLKAQGVTPDYIHAMQSAGFKNLRAHDYISAKAQGVTPEFIQKVHSHGFNNLTMRQLIELKNADVF